MLVLLAFYFTSFLSFRLQCFRCLFCLIEDTLLQRVDRIGDGIDFLIPCLSRCVSSLFVVCVIFVFVGMASAGPRYLIIVFVCCYFRIDSICFVVGNFHYVSSRCLNCLTF